jgi:site-specific DNA-cytosine methylase
MSNFLEQKVSEKHFLTEYYDYIKRDYYEKETPLIFDKAIVDGKFSNMESATVRKNDYEIAGCLTAQYYKGLGSKGQNLVGIKNRIRKLTPLECWRLMGFSDEQFRKAEAVNSNTQLYKQAGNSIVVNVLEGIFRNLFQEPENGTAMQMNLF